MRTIIDTSVIVSGMISPHGSPSQVLKHWLAKDFVLLYTTAIRKEWEDVLYRAWLTERLAHVPNRIPDFLAAIDILGELIKGYVNIAGAVRDPFDEMFLACAILGKADYLVSVDKVLLSLERYRETAIVTPAQFLAILHNNKG